MWQAISGNTFEVGHVCRDSDRHRVALTPLTVAFHEPGFVRGLNSEHRQGCWFQLSDAQRQRVGSPWRPGDPQSLNRYTYVRNNPLRYTDPSGHNVRYVEIGSVVLFLGAEVHNDSSHDVYVTGERPLYDAHGKYMRDADGTIQSATIRVKLRPGESTNDYGIVDADFIQVADTPIEGRGAGGGEVYKIPDFAIVTLVDRPFFGDIVLMDTPITLVAERSGRGGWIPSYSVGIPECVENEPSAQCP